MSYDVTIGDEYFNYTYNLGRFFRDFGVRPTGWDGMNAGALAFIIANAFPEITVEKLGNLDAYNPNNGWGTWQGATTWLADVMVACLENPDATVEAT